MIGGTRLGLGVALDGAGWHPAAWRDPAARPAELFGAEYWVALVRLAERGGLDFVSIDDSFGIQSSDLRRIDERTDQVRGRLDATLVATHVAAVTDSIGILPVATVTHPEPFHIASAISTLDWVSGGRGGWQPRVSGRPEDARLVGPDRTAATIDDLFDEAADAVEVVRRLWDSWEDGAIIRDVATGRFIDRDKLHYVDFDGRFFSVKGPSIVPRPPQGQPVVAVLAHRREPFELAAKQADVVFVTPAAVDDLVSIERLDAEVAAAEEAVEREGERLQRFGDLIVFLGDTTAEARARKDRLDALDGIPLKSDAPVFVGTADALIERLVAWWDHGLEGVRLRPAVLPTDLTHIVERLVPELQRRGLRAAAPPTGTLRDRLGLPPAVNRYAAAREAVS